MILPLYVTRNGTTSDVLDQIHEMALFADRTYLSYAGGILLPSMTSGREKGGRWEKLTGQMANNHSDTEKRLWDAADEFRANSDLKSSEYATPVLGLIFLRYSDHRFTLAEKELEGKGSGRRQDWQGGLSGQGRDVPAAS